MFTFIDFIRTNHSRFPEHTAVVDDHARLSHRELSERSWAIARGLVEAGVQPGDRVAVLGTNSIFTIEAFLGTLAAGAVFVPLNWRWAPVELRHGITLTKPSVILVEDEFGELFDGVLAHEGEAFESTVIRQGPDYEALMRAGDGPFEVERSLDDPAVIIFTGGTTGFSKGVVLAHRSVLFNALDELVDLGYGSQPDQVGLCLVPLFHSASLLCVFANHYLTGGTTVLMAKFTEEGFADVVERERVTATFIIPNMLRRLLKQGILNRPGMASLRQIHSGGGLLLMPDKLAIKHALPGVELFFRYGLTEAGPMVTRLHDKDILRPELDGSIGTPYSFVEIRLVDPFGDDVPDGELGEIWVRGPKVMIGYFDQPDATEATLTDGWLRTGDLAVRGAEGNLYFKDRAKDMIKTGGENVYAAEIEQLLYTHPAVMECGVVGVPSTDWDEEVRAVVALRDGKVLDAKELQDFLRNSLAGYKIPKLIEFVDPTDMPVNPSGKIIKSKLREVVGW